MREKIHPKCEPVTITCTCGAVIKTTSTLCKNFTIELCSKCHPFFTGKQRLVDTTGRLERFQKRYEKFKESKVQKKGAKQATENKEAQ